MASRTWNKDDLDFDGYGRLVIKNEALQQEIERHAEGAEKWGDNLITLARCPDPLPPMGLEGPKGPPIPPPDLCGCYRLGNLPKKPQSSS